MIMKLLVVEDNVSLMELMTATLKKEGYVVETATGYMSALDKISGYSYDCILLDLNLPDGNGLDILKEIKRSGARQNVIITSARDTIEDKVLGLELGADDYLAKPFHLAELVARIRSVIRRSRNGGELVCRYGNVSVDDSSQRVYVDGKELGLLKKEYSIIRYFMSRPGHVIDKAALAEAVWGDNADQVDDYQFLYAQVKNLRKKLAAAGADIEIKAIYGFGYKLI